MNKLSSPIFALIMGLISIPGAAADKQVSDRWIQIEFRGGPWPAGLTEEIEMDFRADLASKKLEVREEQPGDADRPLGIVVFTLLDAEKIEVAIDIRDLLTEKRIGRNIRVGDLPQRGWSLALAIAAEELLVASWVELVMESTQKPNANVPPEILATAKSAVKRANREEKAFRHEVRTQFSVDHYIQGLTFLGGDIYYSLWPQKRIAVELGFGGQGAIPMNSDSGLVEGYAIIGELNIVGSLLPERMMFLLDLGVGARITVANFSGRSTSDNIGTGGTESSTSAHIILRPGIRVTEYFFIRLELGGGYSMRAINFKDVNKVASGVSRFYLRGGLSLSAVF